MCLPLLKQETIGALQPGQIPETPLRRGRRCPQQFAARLEPAHPATSRGAGSRCESVGMDTASSQLPYRSEVPRGVLHLLSAKDCMNLHSAARASTTVAHKVRVPRSVVLDRCPPPLGPALEYGRVPTPTCLRCAMVFHRQGRPVLAIDATEPLLRNQHHRCPQELSPRAATFSDPPDLVDARIGPAACTSPCTFTLLAREGPEGSLP